MSGLDETYRRLGMHDKVLEMQESALAMCRRILRRSTKHCCFMSNRALTYRLLGKLDQAVTIYESTLAMGGRILPEDHQNIAESMSNLTVTYGDLGMHEKAL